MDADFKDYITTNRKRIDHALDHFLPGATAKPATVHKAMRHSLFAGGKRLRPVLAMAAAEACGGDPEHALPGACAIECIHTFSLVHDDLPCMDDDDFRRGKPTCHKIFGEGVAVLAGDALQASAFEILTTARATKQYGVADYVRELAATSGSRELIGGQVMDLEGEGQELDHGQLRAIHEKKTAALLTTSVRFGGMSADATPRQLDLLTGFGRALGLAFQVIDDILDVTQTTEKLGKTAGKDEAVDKSTYPAIIGLEPSRKEATRLTQKAISSLSAFGKKGHRLDQLAHYLLDRDY